MKSSASAYPLIPAVFVLAIIPFHNGTILTWIDNRAGQYCGVIRRRPYDRTVVLASLAEVVVVARGSLDRACCRRRQIDDDSGRAFWLHRDHVGIGKIVLLLVDSYAAHLLVESVCVPLPAWVGY